MENFFSILLFQVQVFRFYICFKRYKIKTKKIMSHTKEGLQTKWAAAPQSHFKRKKIDKRFMGLVNFI